MNLRNRLRQFEDSITRAVDGMARRVPQATAPREPLEIMLAIVDLIERQTQHAGHGRRVFPFNRIKVTVAAGRADRARYEAVFADPPTLEQRVAESLATAGCAPGQLAIKVGFAAEGASSWSDPMFDVEFSRVAAASEPPPAPVAAPERLEMTIVFGTAERAAYTFADEVVYIGRCVEVLDTRKRVVRINQLAFCDDANRPNASVSRRHAHIRRDSTGAYHVVDDHSARGTCVLRGGRTIAVPPGGRGLRIRTGDELILGEARVGVSIVAGETDPQPSSISSPPDRNRRPCATS
jgi:hypothetical protein